MHPAPRACGGGLTLLMPGLPPPRNAFNWSGCPLLSVTSSFRHFKRRQRGDALSEVTDTAQNLLLVTRAAGWGGTTGLLSPLPLTPREPHLLLGAALGPSFATKVSATPSQERASFIVSPLASPSPSLQQWKQSVFDPAARQSSVWACPSIYIHLGLHPTPATVLGVQVCYKTHANTHWKPRDHFLLQPKALSGDSLPKLSTLVSSGLSALISLRPDFPARLSYLGRAAPMCGSQRKFSLRRCRTPTKTPGVLGTKACLHLRSHVCLSSCPPLFVVFVVCCFCFRLGLRVPHSSLTGNASAPQVRGGALLSNHLLSFRPHFRLPPHPAPRTPHSHTSALWPGVTVLFPPAF